MSDNPEINEAMKAEMEWEHKNLYNNHYPNNIDHCVKCGKRTSVMNYIGSIPYCDGCLYVKMSEDANRFSLTEYKEILEKEKERVI